MVAKIQVKNLGKLQRQLTKAGRKDIANELKKAGREAGEIVKTEARERQVPVRTGKLRRSINLRVTQRSVKIKAGGARTYYGRFVHWGTRINRPNRFLTRAFAIKRRKVEKEYNERVQKWARDLNRLR
jgi:HK97 gp10 family phage protein